MPTNAETEVRQRAFDGRWIVRVSLPFGFHSEDFATQAEAMGERDNVVARFAALLGV